MGSLTVMSKVVYRTEEDSGSLKAQLAWRKKCIAGLTPEEFKYAITKRPLAHYRLALKSSAIWAACIYTTWHNHDNPWIWIPSGFVQGSLLVAIIFLMHECCHRNLFNERSPLKDAITDWTARFYGLFTMNTMWFFRIYHNQHHQFFQGTDDPKATHFVPKDNKRWPRIKYIIPGGLVKVFLSLREAYKLNPSDTKIALWEGRSGKTLQFFAACVLVYNYGWLFWIKIH